MRLTPRPTVKPSATPKDAKEKEHGRKTSATPKDAKEKEHGRRTSATTKDAKEKERGRRTSATPKDAKKRPEEKKSKLDQSEDESDDCVIMKPYAKWSLAPPKVPWPTRELPPPPPMTTGRIAPWDVYTRLKRSIDPRDL